MNWKPMRNAFAAVLLVTFVFPPFALAGASTQSQAYGGGVTLSERTRVSDILADPDAYLGKTVLVEGTVVKVCRKRGCWMEIAGDKEVEKIQIKVRDGVMVFPLSA